MWIYDPITGTFKFVALPAGDGTMEANGTLDFNNGDLLIDLGLRSNGSVIDCGDRLV